MRKACGLAVPILLGFALALVPLTDAFAHPHRMSRRSERRDYGHDGFFLRLSAGPGAARTELENVYDPDLDQVGDLEFSGTSLDYNLALGGIVSPNLALHATLAGWVLEEPDVEFDGIDEGEADFDLSMTMVGLGITSYFMPSNMYFSVSAGPAWLRFEDVVGDDQSDTGLGIDAMLGKEWWVGPQVGLGLAGAANYHSIPSEGPADEDYTGLTFAVRGSLTFN